MSGRHQPVNGADSYQLDDSGKADHECDYCGRTVYQSLLRTVNIGGSLSFLCETCHERQADEYRRMTGEADYADAELQRAKDWSLL